MKRLLNTLYVTTPGAGIRKDGQNVVVELEGAEIGRVPLHLLGALVVFGPIWLSPALTGACAEAGVCVVLLDRNGRFLARIEGPVAGNVLLRRAQYKASESRPHAPGLHAIEPPRQDLGERGREIVRSLVMGKLANQRVVIQRSLRDHAAKLDPTARGALEAAAARLADILRRASRPDLGSDHLRGLEGEAAQVYFASFDHMLHGPDAGLRFRGRSRRPPRDGVNALLSFLYTLLAHDCRAALESVGLDPAVGFLHRDRPGRPSLALDLMEELRPALADRLALSLINRRQLRARDFVTQDGGGVTMTDEARKLVLVSWQERKRVERTHPFLGEAAPLGLVAHLQAQLLARHLRDDLDGYPPWLWK